MILRWTASTLLWAEQRFKRVEGCDYIQDLEKSLRALQNDTTLNTA